MDKEKIYIILLSLLIILTTLIFIDTTPFGFIQPKYVTAGFLILLSIFFYPYKEFLIPNKFLPLFLFFLIPGILIGNPVRGGKFFTWYLFLFVSFLLFYQIPDEKRKFFHRILFYLLLLISLISILDFFSIPPFSWGKYKEFPPQIWATIGNSNMVGEFIILLLPFSSLYFLFLPLFALSLTFSKGCIIGLLSSFSLFYFKKKYVILIFLALIIIFLFLLRLPYFQKFLTFHGRMEVWRISLNMFKEKPFLGWGWESYKYHLPYFEDSRFHKVLPNVNVEFAHNDYLQFLTEGGIIGGLAIFFLLLYIIKLNIRKIWFIGGLALIFESFVSFPFYSPLSSLLFFSLGGLEGERKGIKKIFHPFLYGIILSPLFICFLLFPFISHIQFRKGNYLSNKNEFFYSIPYYKRAITLDPSFELSYVNLGVSYYHLGKKEQAKKLWDEALKINPSSISALLNLKTYYEEKKDFSKEKQIDYLLKKIEH